MTNLSASFQDHHSNLLGNRLGNYLKLTHSSRYRFMPQGMIGHAIMLMVLALVLASCQHVSSEMNTASQVISNETSDLDLASADTDDASGTGVANASASSDALDSTEMSVDTYTFVEGRGYMVSWPPEERFVISPPDDIRKQMAAKCANEGYITAFITSMELHDDQIIGYFLCRGIGG